jgi:hypothetical protein
LPARFGQVPDPVHDALGEGLNLPSRDRHSGALPRVQQPTPELVIQAGHFGRLPQQLRALREELTGSPTRRPVATPTNASANFIFLVRPRK